MMTMPAEYLLLQEPAQQGYDEPHNGGRTAGVTMTPTHHPEQRQPDALAEALLSRETLDERESLRVTGLPPATPETAMLRVASKAS
jgi:hypothetical protein